MAHTYNIPLGDATYNELKWSLFLSFSIQRNSILTTSTLSLICRNLVVVIYLKMCYILITKGNRPHGVDLDRMIREPPYRRVKVSRVVFLCLKSSMTYHVYERLNHNPSTKTGIKKVIEKLYHLNKFLISYFIPQRKSKDQHTTDQLGNGNCFSKNRHRNHNGY